MGALLAASAWRDWTDGREPLATPATHAGITLASWAATQAQMVQPPLDHHLIAIHLGGPKRVIRAGGGRIAHAEMEVGDFSTVEAGHGFRWRTEGPIRFAHLFVAPDRFAADIGRIFDRDPAGIAMPDLLGRRDPLVPQLVRVMFAAANVPEGGLWLDEALERLFAQLGATVLGLREGPFRAPLPPHRVRRVRDHVRGNLARPIALADLAEVAASSPWHFIRAFRAATGFTPYAFVINERVAVAMELLATSELPVEAVARATGLGAPAQFSSRFKAVTGVAPREFRRRVRGGDGQKPCTSWTM